MGTVLKLGGKSMQQKTVQSYKETSQEFVVFKISQMVQQKIQTVVISSN